MLRRPIKPSLRLPGHDGARQCTVKRSYLGCDEAAGAITTLPGQSPLPANVPYDFCNATANIRLPDAACEVTEQQDECQGLCPRRAGAGHADGSHAADGLRHIAGTQWATRKYINMTPLFAAQTQGAVVA